MKIQYKPIFNESINDYKNPLEEEFYNTPNKEDYLNNQHFHHSHKGCEVEMRKKNDGDNNISINKFCKTHQVLCSKTGWELGWYLGTDTRAEYEKRRICERCGNEFTYTAHNAKFCEPCRPLAATERINAYSAKMRLHYKQIKQKNAN